MPEYPHRIRLRGPWDVVPLDGSTPRHMTMPGRLADAGLVGFSGWVKLIRRFGFPGRLDAFERVHLLCDGFEGIATVSVNGTMIGEQFERRFAFEITSLLEPRNQLEVALDAANDQAGLWGETAMEVRCQAWLEDLAISREGGLWLMGRAVGVSDVPLDLYAIVDGKQSLYRMVKPSAEGTPFREPLEHDGVAAKVELVHVSTAWWTQQIAMFSGEP
ncbi:MAG: hypothetical protein K2X38_11700 [Gemmataceae bacterium]|nr:hypothetical protein [Gemmataceae bacterium]